MGKRLQRGVGVAIALSAAAGVIIGGAVSAGVGSAQGTLSLDLFGTAQNRIGFADARGVPRQGDRIGGGSRVTGDDSGISRSVCTRIGKGAICQVQLELSRGTISAQGLIPLAGADQTPISITGGTGAYDGARGTAIATDTAPGETRFDIALLP
jgi:hypothetical protein